MRRFRALIIVGIAAAAFALPEQTRGQEAGLGDAPVAAEADARLEQLYDRLAQTDSAAEARGVALLIQRRWLESGSPTADLLMERARRAMGEGDPALAIELIDRILVIEPRWAEAWNRRAIAFTMLDDPVSAIADIYRVVSLEPRHFAAWAGLGNLLMRSGDDRRALESFERALAVNPHLPRIDAIVAKLRRDVDGVEL